MGKSGAGAAGEVCVSARDGFVRIEGAFAPGGGAFASVDSAAKSVIVASKAGVQELSLDGHLTRTLTATPAEAARFMPDGRQLLFLTASMKELRLISVSGGKERVVARLPPRYAACAKAEQAFTTEDLGIQQDEDFVVDVDGRTACLDLQDRNENAMSMQVSLRVTLANGAIEQAFPYAEGCPGGQRLPPCVHAPMPSAGASGTTVPVNAKFGVPDFVAGPRSPSGRWGTALGNESEGDYIHRQLFLIDANDGKVWPIRGHDVRALTARELRSLEVETEDVVGETPLRWLSGSPDLLLVNNHLVKPGSAAMATLPGAVAF
jgi:hypothetical protein